MKKITLFTLLTFITTVSFGQLELQSFEVAADAESFAQASSIGFEYVENPFKDDNNDSDNCLKISSTDGAHAWWGLIRIPVDPVVTISAAESKFLSIMVNYPAQPDLAVRLLGSGVAQINGTNPQVLRALNQYDSSEGKVNTWQEIVFEIKDGPDAFAYTHGDLDRIVFHPDVADRNEPSGRVISDVVFGYIDNIRILDENPLTALSVENISLEDAISIYPTSVASTFKVKTTQTINNVSLFNILGKEVSKNMVNLNNEAYDISSLVTGVYIVKVTVDNGSFMTKKIIKK
ncbi:T9SS type A sorting domain-containing protein [uncultured Polaribacter sp.]|uniref:T9SS type A sorting domain-containing protein n=1 Tax=uncultured Polaribacter sp. TaxID=174711 RepID=UPI00261D7A85|nr:T9SS type A sorting domain-containing protein [uncultured Polaribacter sp.]